MDIEEIGHVLKLFLIQWRTWAEGGGEGIWPLTSNLGLCSNLEHWLDDGDYGWDERGPILDLLGSLLSQDYEDCYYPFGGRVVYTREKSLGTMHLNPDRLGWVINTISKLEGQ